MSNLADALLAGYAAAPKLDPVHLYGLAQSSALDDVPDNATATEAFGDIAKRVSYLQAQDNVVQASAWASAGDEERRMLAAAGYKAPALKRRSSGPFAAVGHFLGGAAEIVLVKPAEEIGRLAGEALHYAGAPLRQLQHAYRSAALITDDNVLAGRGQWSLNGVFSPSEWAQMWRLSEHGEQTFSPVALRDLQNRYDPQTLDLAKQLAGGAKVTDLVGRANAEDRQALVQRIQTDPTLGQAVKDLNVAKLSVGRRVVGTDLQAAHPELGRVLSGGLDATADWFGDPVVIGAKFAKGAEVARFLVRSPEDVSRLVDRSKQVDRALGDVVDTLNAGGASALMQRWPKLAAVAPQLVAENVDSKEKLAAWFGGQAGLGALLDGRATGALRDGVQMIHLSPTDRAALAAKGGLRNVVDWAADPARIARLTGDDQAVSTLERARLSMSRKAETVKHLVTLTAKGRTINIEDPNAITTVERFANTVLPSERVADAVNAWAAAETVTQKRDIWKALQSDVFDAANVSPEFRERFTSQFDEAVRKPVFSGSGADQVVRDGVETSVGLDAPHFTTEWAMPSFKDLYRESKRVSTLNRVYNGTVNADGIDRFMNNVWKPTMLLRLGFPIRAGGEELVGAIMREGVGGLVRGRLAAGATQAGVSEEKFAQIAESLQAGRIGPETAREFMDQASDKLLPFHPLARVWDRYATALPEPIRNLVETPADFAGAVIGDRARRAFRNMEGRLAGQDYMNAARELWRAGPLQEAFTSEIAATESRAAGFLDDTPSVIKVAKGGGNARPAYFAPTGDFSTSLPGDSLYTLKWKKNLDELGQGPLFRAALEGVGGDRESQVQAVVDRIESPGYAKMRDFADRSRFTRDGRTVGVDATEAEANRDWAEAVVDHVNSLVHSGAEGAAGGTLPPVAEGYVRLWRGEKLENGQYVPLESVMGTADQALGSELRKDTAGRWFHENRGVTQTYVNEAGRLKYVDVPEEVANAADVRNLGAEHMAKIHTTGVAPGEYVVPKEWAAKAREYRFEGAQIPEADTERWYQLLDQAAAQGADVFPEVMQGVHPAGGGGVSSMDWAENRDRILRDLDAQIAAHAGTPAEATLRELRDVSANLPVSQLQTMPGTATPIPGLAERVLTERHGPTVAELSDMPADLLPGAVKGRDMIPVSRNWVRDVMDRGFEQVVGRPMDWMVRQPLFIHNYAQSLREAEALRPLVGAGELGDSHIRQIAVERAVAKTVPFIHDPQMRSQMSVITRNLAPFWFAQEQFYKRWVNVAKHSPEAFREAQLVMMGLRHSGVLHTDDQGNDTFIYPGPAVVQDAISKGFETLTGKKVSLPLPVGFSGQVRFATPGLERLGVPSFGPLVGIPVHALAQRFPELDQVEAGVLGERGAGRAYWEQLTPTTISRLVHVATDNPNTSPQMASAMMQAMAYLEAKGFAPADNASPPEREAYIDRVKNWTRILFLNRTLFGYAAPASPDLQMDPDQLHSRFRELLSQLPIEEAQAEFLKEHPDATPYTVFQSKSASGATLPATQKAADFMSANEAFLRTYPQAGGWFVPQTSGDPKFSLPAYREQLALEMRQRKTPEQFYSDLKYAEAADQYFANRDRKDVMLEGVSGETATKLRQTNPALLAKIVAEGAGAKAAGTRAQNINHAWATWKDEFLAAHPVFGAELQSPDAQIQRQQSLDQMRTALQDPRLPTSPQVDGIRTLVAAFDDVQSAIRPLQGLTSTWAAAQRKAVKGALATWAEKYVVDHPESAGFYNRVLRAQVEA